MPGAMLVLGGTPGRAVIRASLVLAAAESPRRQPAMVAVPATSVEQKRRLEIGAVIHPTSHRAATSAWTELRGRRAQMVRRTSFQRPRVKSGKSTDRPRFASDRSESGPGALQAAAS